MNKPLCIVSSPVDTFSGYGARSRDFIKSLIKAKGDEWDIKLLSQRWGQTPFGFLNETVDNEKDLLDRIIPQMTTQPDAWFQITVPNEFQSVGKHLNIGVTAGIETTICDPSWVEGCNRMTLNLVSSQHAKTVFENSQFEQKDATTNKTTAIIKLTAPVETLFEGVDLNKYFKATPPQTDLIQQISKIKEDFCFLFVGHWLQGDFGEDRKNVGYMIKAFLEVFKGKTNAPALIMKTNSATTSIMDRNSMLEKIEAVRKTVKGRTPNIYLLHGDLEDEDMNDLYNHPKIKSMISFTKGEGFGRPLLEFSLTNKPIITTNWSGHIDYLNPEFVTLLQGTLTKVHPSAANNMLLAEAEWFSVDHGHVGHYLKDMFENYKNYTDNAKRQGFQSRTKFSFDAMKNKLDELFTTKIPEFPKQVQIQLPKLNKIELPKLKKVN